MTDVERTEFEFADPRIKYIGESLGTVLITIPHNLALWLRDRVNIQSELEALSQVRFGIRRILEAEGS